MKTTLILIKRNMKLFFKDKGMFFTSLITPLILLVLYTTFLGNIYRDTFKQVLGGFQSIVPEKVIEGCVGGQLFASLLAVSCVTVAFCSNFLMVQDKVTGARADLTMSPVSKSTMAFAYYVASLLSTLLVCFVAIGLSFVYLAFTGWYLSVTDVFAIFLDVFLIVMFGTGLSSIINYFLTSQGQISAVGSIVSSCYGFICGAYMPISQFSEGLQKLLSFLPGTYATALIKNHALRGVFAEMEGLGVPEAAIKDMMAGIDCTPSLLGNEVSVGGMYAILAITVLVLLGVYIGINLYKKKKKE